MTFAELLATLEAQGAVAPSRAKDLRTSLTYLARALGHAGLDDATLCDACRDPARWTAALATHFAALAAEGKPKGMITQRNTKGNIRAAFRAAEKLGLLAEPLPSTLLKSPGREAFRKQKRGTSFYKNTYGPDAQTPYHLKQDQWPKDIVKGWKAYVQKTGFRLRATTLETYSKCLASYFGYVRTIRGETPTWKALFDAEKVADYVRWHAARNKRTLTVHGRMTATIITAIAHVLEHPGHEALRVFTGTLKPPTPLHTKRNHMLPLNLLDKAADSFIAEGRLPVIPVKRRVSQHVGAQRAHRFQAGLILKLLIRVPLRQRNIREMQRDTHLTQDPATGHWHLEYQGDDLKIGYRGEKVNTYRIDLTEYCPSLIPLLEEWLNVRRPAIKGAADSDYVFLTLGGRPHDTSSFYKYITELVEMRTGRRFYPHLVRTMWLSEYLHNGGDITVAATMLGDKPETALKNYHDFLTQDHHKRAHDALPALLTNP
jgi:hypothetical protein